MNTGTVALNNFLFDNVNRLSGPSSYENSGYQREADNIEPPLLSELGIDINDIKSKLKYTFLLHKRIPLEIANNSEMTFGIGALLVLILLSFFNTPIDRFRTLFYFFVSIMITVYSITKYLPSKVDNERATKPSDVPFYSVTSAFTYGMSYMVFWYIIYTVLRINTISFTNIILGPIFVVLSSISASRFISSSREDSAAQSILLMPIFVVIYALFAVLLTT